MLPIGQPSAATLDDLKQLEITCYVPSYLPQGLRLKNVEITYDEIQENEDQNHPLPLYSVQYGNGWSATFTIESAREGIGDRNIMDEEENAEETEIKSRFGPMYLIYRPKGKDGRKDEIIANWVSDPNMNDEKTKARIPIRSSAGFMDFLQPELRSQSSRRSFNHFTRSGLTRLLLRCRIRQLMHRSRKRLLAERLCRH
jgi:hypothetical protein